METAREGEATTVGLRFEQLARVHRPGSISGRALCAVAFVRLCVSRAPPAATTRTSCSVVVTADWRVMTARSRLTRVHRCAVGGGFAIRMQMHLLRNPTNHSYRYFYSYYNPTGNATRARAAARVY